MSPTTASYLPLALLTCTLFSSCHRAPAEPPPPQPPPAEVTRPGGPDCVTDFVSCQEDIDCIEVPEGCCGCAMGGRDIAIHQSCREAWLARLDSCAGTICTAQFNCIPGAQPRCEAYRCVLSSRSDPSATAPRASE